MSVEDESVGFLRWREQAASNKTTAKTAETTSIMKAKNKGKEITEVDGGDDDAFGEIRDFKQRDKACRHIKFTTGKPTKEYCSSCDVCMSLFCCVRRVWLRTLEIDRQ